MTLFKLIKSKEFFNYFIIGGVATLIDWSTFWVLTAYFALHYQISLCCAYVTAGLFHYIANKLLTFNCQSKKIGSQVSIYFIVSITSLLFSMGVLGLLIHYTPLQDMIARMLTTLIMLVPNYFLHKYITFSKKIFVPHETH